MEPPAGVCTAYTHDRAGFLIYHAGGHKAPNSPNTAASAVSRLACALPPPVSGPQLRCFPPLALTFPARPCENHRGEQVRIGCWECPSGRAKNREERYPYSAGWGGWFLGPVPPWLRGDERLTVRLDSTRQDDGETSMMSPKLLVFWWHVRKCTMIPESVCV